VGGTESLGLDQTPLLSMGGGDRLVGGLTSSDSVVGKGCVVSYVTDERNGRGGG